jgi:hypothetical protein
VLPSSAVEDAQAKLTDGSKWTVQSQVGVVPHSLPPDRSERPPIDTAGFYLHVA